MSIEDKIKELEQQLELKKAWMSVSISFGRGNKISEELKQQITEQIEEFCYAKAEGLEVAVERNTELPFTPEEMSTLKQLAQAALTRKAKPSQNNAKHVLQQTSSPIEYQKQQNKGSEPLFVEVARTDNIPYPESDSIQVGDRVKVVGFKDEHVTIQLENGKTFGVLRESLAMPAKQ